MRVVVAALIAACTQPVAVPRGPDIPALPSEHGPAWSEITSEHFVLWTDADIDRARKLVRAMESHRRLVFDAIAKLDKRGGGRGAVAATTSNVKVFAVALRDAAEVAVYVARRFGAFAWGAAAPLYQPVIVLDAGAPHGTVIHELTHVVMVAAIPDEPRWFAEGIASYFESATQRGRIISLGPPVPSGSPIASAKLFACRQLTCVDHAFYRSARDLFAYLVDVHPGGLLRLMNRMKELGDQPDRAWHEVFPELDFETLDRELRDWRTRPHDVIRHDATFVETTLTERSLGDADALAARGLLRFMASGDTPDTRADVAASLIRDRANLVARLIAMALERTISFNDARATADAHPEDWRAWLLLGASGTDAIEARDRLCGLGPPDEWKSKLCAE